MDKPTESQQQTNIGYFATRPLQLRWLTGIALGFGLIAWATGWLIVIDIGNALRWDFEPFNLIKRLTSKVLSSPDADVALLLTSGYAALTAVSFVCLIFGMRPALKPNAWLLVSLMMAGAALLPIAIGFSVGFILDGLTHSAHGTNWFIVTLVSCYLLLLTAAPFLPWVIHRQFNIRAKQTLVACTWVFGVVTLLIVVSVGIDAARKGYSIRRPVELIFFLVPTCASFGLFCLTLFRSRKLYKQQLWQLDGSACLHCGYDLQGLPEETQNCPECGCGIVRKVCDIPSQASASR
jgi:hypothetical protein